MYSCTPDRPDPLACARGCRNALVLVALVAAKAGLLWWCLGGRSVLNLIGVGCATFGLLVAAVVLVCLIDQAPERVADRPPEGESDG